MKFYNKAISILMTLILVFSSMSGSYAQVEQESITVDDYIMTMIVKEKNYEKMSLKDINTNEVQYLEYFKNKEGLGKFVVLDENNDIISTIEQKEKEIIVKDEANQIIDRINLIQENTEISFESMEPMASWGTKHSTSGSRNTYYTDVLIVYGIIASLVSAGAGVPSVMAVASYIVNHHIQYCIKVGIELNGKMDYIINKLI